MNRDEMLGKLRSVNGPLFLFTAFADGVTCEYITRRGGGFMELLDWSDLDVLDEDSANEEWGDLKDDELAEWVRRFESGEFIKYRLEPAMSMRGAISQQLHVINPGET